MDYRFKTPYNAHKFPVHLHMESSRQPSLTIPDQTMSMREIMDRFARGLPIEAGKVPVYEGDEDITPDWNRLDLSEKMELAREASEKIKEFNDNQDKARKKKEKAALKAQLIEEIEAERTPAPQPGKEAQPTAE